MPIQPIDMQTLFMRLNQVGKEQAVQKEAAHLAQTQAASELVRESETHAHSVNETPDLEDGLEAVDEDEQKRKEREAEEQERNEEAGEKKKREIFRDPDLGSKIDIVG